MDAAIVVPAATGLIGTAVGVAMSELRWRREHREQRGADFRSARNTAYLKLAELVGEVELRARTAERLRDEVIPLTLMTNSYLLRNAVLIDGSDRRLVERYLASMLAFVEAVVKYGEAETRAALFSTQTLDDEFPDRVDRLGKLYRDFDDLGDELHARVRSVVGDEDATSWRRGFPTWGGGRRG